MKIQVSGKFYYGDPETIVRKLRERDHGRPRDVDAYIKRVAASLDFRIEGSTIADRCEAFLVEAIKTGFALPVFHPEHVDANAIRVARKARSLSKERLANQLDVALMTINRWEDATTRPEAKRFERIRMVLFENTGGPASTRSATNEPSLMASRERQRAAGRWRGSSTLAREL